MRKVTIVNTIIIMKVLNFLNNQQIFWWSRLAFPLTCQLFTSKKFTCKIEKHQMRKACIVGPYSTFIRELQRKKQFQLELAWALPKMNKVDKDEYV